MVKDLNMLYASWEENRERSKCFVYDVWDVFLFPFHSEKRTSIPIKMFPFLMHV